MEKTTNLEEQIFLGALELRHDENRNEFLKNQCGNDVQLRNRVEELLAFHQRGDNILDDTSGGLMGRAGEVDSITVGTEIGPYKLLQEIGAGGMGVVFMAEQIHPVRRKVAIKIIKLGMDTRNVIARFEAERQALAMMDHPNITKIFDAGITTTGRPYFVMELVTGLAITEYCDREQLPLKDRIELFYHVCVGIKHAHQKGIIHRDLKPSNVMVTHYDGVAVPKIIDFGIAKAVDQSLTEKTLFTSYGNMIGTPEYMSPEQAEMSGQDIDTRADVYSLGVLMYELLTGTTPFHHWKQKGIHKFCEAICHEEPELASTRVNNLADTVNDVSRNRGMDVRSLKRILRGDMDWIMSKCMSKKCNDRYETAADLARDVKRYLDGQPVEAVGPNISYRARKFVNKHRTAISLAAVILFTLCAATIVSTVFAVQATRAQRLATHRLQKVNKLMLEAERERDRAQLAETQLKHMERNNRAEVAAWRASDKYNRDANHEIQIIHAVGDDQHDPKVATWSGQRTVADSDGNVIRIEQIERSDVAGTQIVDIAATVDGSATSSDSESHQQSFQIIFGDAGKMKVTNATNLDAKTLHAHGPHQKFIVVEDQHGAGKTKKFLQLLVNEQQELFGSDDDVVANTLFEIGNMSLKHKDWPGAENNFRQVRNILKHHANKDGRLAKVELMLSKALLNQEKTTAAREAIANGVLHLEKLDEVPDELVEVMVELKGTWKDLNLHLHELGEMLPEDVKEKLRTRIEQELNFEFHKNK